MSPIAIVTGAASGIGRATACRLAADGYLVAMMDLDAEGLARTRADIVAISPIPSLITSLDSAFK